MNHYILDGRYKDLFKLFDLDVEIILKKAKLPEDILNHKSIKMYEKDYYQLLTVIGEISKDPELPIKMATTSQIESFSPPIYASYCSKNGEVCIERLSKYKKLIGPMSIISKTKGNKITVLYEAGEAGLKLPSFLVQSEFAFLIGIIRKATELDIKPTSIIMEEIPSSNAFKDFVGIEPTLGNVNAITFSKSDLNEPFISYNKSMWSYFESELNRRLSELDVDDSVGTRVRSVLTELLPGGSNSIEEVAEKLGISKRILQRKLSEEGTTFQKELNNTRKAMALHYVKNTNISTNDIAYLLSYAEVNSFLRAFTIWTGKSLTEFKRTN